MKEFLMWWTNNEEFGIKISLELVNEMQNAFDNCEGFETGGVLLGKYIERHCAEITSITTAPTDSAAGQTWFHRGIRKLQEMIDSLWKQKREYYLGEWHCHPMGAAKPSKVDIQTMENIAKSDAYKCPEPILIIMGGEPHKRREMGVFVCPAGRDHLVMDPLP